jgi:transcriptional regulator with XRE-family HTH domain
MDRRDHTERAATGARIREAREERGLSQEQVETLSGISQETLSRIENGHRDPRLDTLRKLAAGLSMDLPELLARMAGSRHE